jgi:long-chain acyl-CoA synthetase
MSGSPIATDRPDRLRPRLLTDLLDHAAATWPDRTAIDFFGRTWTYARLATMVERTARGLQDRGLRPGDRFGICLPNCPYFIVLYFAALRAGAAVVNFNPLYTERELAHQIRDAGVRMIAVPDLAAVHGKVEAIARSVGIETIVLCEMTGMLPRLQGLGFALLKRKLHARITDPALHLPMRRLLASRGAPDPVAVTPDDLAVLQYTGGTTGVPKGAMLTHANLTANSAQMKLHTHGVLPERCSVLGVLPMFHVFALTTVLNHSVDIGAEIILLPRLEMPQMLKAIRRKPPTLMFVVPTICVAINDLPRGQAPDLSAMRACISGGAPLPLEVREQFEGLTGAKVVEGYGLSETSPIIACNPLDGVIKDNSCGPAFPGTVLEIRDPADPARLMPQGERGEVWARGPQVMKGYWQRPDETGAVLSDGALRTGDIGYLDEEGYLFLVDRIKDVILCGGFNVYPRMIEDAAYQHPAVKEAVAIGVPDRYRGQSPKLFVALHEPGSLSEEALCAFLGERLSRIEMPRHVEFREALPKTMIGKLSKKELIDEEARKVAA